MILKVLRNIVEGKLCLPKVGIHIIDYNA